METNVKRLIRTLICFALFIPVFLIKIFYEGLLSERAFAALFGAIYLAAGYDVLYKAFRNIKKGRIFDENFLMCAASLGAFALGIFGKGEYAEAVAVMLFYQTGEIFQSYAVGKSRRSVAALMDIRPDSANVVRDGKEISVSPEEVSVGEIFVVRGGEKIPLDGKIEKGSCNLDMRALTGESVPVFAKEGMEVLSGSISLDGEITVRAEREFYDGTAAKILDLVENSAGRKAKTENFITVFSKYYTPFVVFSALAFAVIPTLISGIFYGNFSVWSEWLSRALTFLVVSCPCAIVISVPLGFFGGIGGAGSKGILIKGAGSVEKLSRANVFVFDKTGTLTKGEFVVTEVCPKEERERVLRIAAICEKGSDHPVAKGVLSAYSADIPEGYALREISGRGMRAEKDGTVLLAGNSAFMKENGIETESGDGTVVFVAENGKYVGKIVLEDEIRESARELVAEIKSRGGEVAMLTGDNAAAAKKVADGLGIENYSSGLLPADKTEALSRIIEKKKKGEEVVFVGDGINDAPVIMLADVGVSMGGIGSDSAIEAADAVLMYDDPKAILMAKDISRRTMRIVKENIVFALAVKFAALVVGALGIAGAYAMWMAVFADVGVSVLAILNSSRALTV